MLCLPVCFRSSKDRLDKIIYNARGDVFKIKYVQEFQRQFTKFIFIESLNIERCTDVLCMENEPFQLFWTPSTSEKPLFPSLERIYCIFHPCFRWLDSVHSNRRPSHMLVASQNAIANQGFPSDGVSGIIYLTRVTVSYSIRLQMQFCRRDIRWIVYLIVTFDRVVYWEVSLLI